MDFNTASRGGRERGRERARERKTGRVRVEGTRRFKGGQRQQHQTRRKQEEAAKTMDVVLSSSLCCLVLSTTPKYTYYITASMGNFPKTTRGLGVSRLSLFSMTAKKIHHQRRINPARHNNEFSVFTVRSTEPHSGEKQ